MVLLNVPLDAGDLCDIREKTMDRWSASQVAHVRGTDSYMYVFLPRAVPGMQWCLQYIEASTQSPQHATHAESPDTFI